MATLHAAIPDALKDRLSRICIDKNLVESEVLCQALTRGLDSIDWDFFTEGESMEFAQQGAEDLLAQEPW
ncbi:MAG: hypothetical protein N838_09380 [Thiohalocapsa sp. PB-PSB1]|jgi:hypothetical protein|nr:MAG: hypothetical protein N838_09380 [Thiohalocapsa sp. PB-PSB1]HCS88732.1 hypothetical protein [Chromatiaceae bacterium]